jgi:hypothetical protein
VISALLVAGRVFDGESLFTVVTESGLIEPHSATIRLGAVDPTVRRSLLMNASHIFGGFKSKFPPYGVFAIKSPPWSIGYHVSRRIESSNRRRWRRRLTRDRVIKVAEENTTMISTAKNTYTDAKVRYRRALEEE